MTAADFVLDPILDADCVTLGRLPLCRVLLRDDARFPWLILVPERPRMAEIIDLIGADRVLLMEEISATSHALKRAFAPDKLNVAALGNQVRQLHIHVVARFVSDAAWPNPVFGAPGAAQPYPAHVQALLADKLVDALGLTPVVSA
jgi:diadenosine tetraphosphate (Ap4A) HIT family hydrolase